jgi:hypothetical protein
MMKAVLISALVLITFSSYSQNCLWDWTEITGSTGSDIATSISTDLVGNSYVTGAFVGTVHFGSDSITSFGSSDIFFAKYDDNGNCLWASHGGSANTTSDGGSGAAIDQFGNCFFTGSCSPNSVIGSFTVNPSSQTNLFVTKFDSAGNVLWAKGASGSASYASGIGTDAAGNAYITGSFSNGTHSFDAFTLTGAGGFVVKYDQSGNVVYATKLGVGAFQCNAIAVDAIGNAYITGWYSDSLYINSQAYFVSGQEIFTVKLDIDGNIAWQKPLDGTPGCYSNARGICVDNNSNVFITGYFSGVIAFASSFYNSGDSDSRGMFLAKYDCNGTELWAKQSQGSAIILPQDNERTIEPHPQIQCYDEEGTAVKVDPQGNIFLTGFSSDNYLFFGSCSLAPLNSSVFIVKYDSMGSCQSALACTNIAARIVSLSLDNSNSIYVAGNSIGADIFLGKIPQSTTEISSYNFKDGLDAFPNPTFSTIRLCTQKLLRQVTISTTDGRTIKTISNIHSSTFNVDMSDLSAGIYFLHCETEMGREAVKVVKQ